MGWAERDPTQPPNVLTASESQSEALGNHIPFYMAKDQRAQRHTDTDSTVKASEVILRHPKKYEATYCFQTECTVTGATGNLVVIYVALDMTATYAVARHRSDKAKQTIKRVGR